MIMVSTILAVASAFLRLGITWEPAERVYFVGCLALGRLLRSATYSRVSTFDVHCCEPRARKRRLFFAPFLVWLGSLLARALDTGVRFLSQREWEARERELYWILHGTSIRIHIDRTLDLPHLAGNTLANLLVDPELDDPSRRRAITCAVAALAEFHRLGFTHGDAMAENVLVDLEAGTAYWFDFETVHELSRTRLWRRADDVRALLATCLVRSAPERFAETLQLILDVYADPRVIGLLIANFTPIVRRPLLFHLAQAGLTFRCYKEITVLLRKRLDETSIACCASFGSSPRFVPAVGRPATASP